MNKKHYILKHGNRQWLAEEGAHLKIDFMKNLSTNDVMEIQCIYDSSVGVCDKMMKFKVLNARFAGEKLRIVKHKRRHNSEKQMGFRSLSTVIKVEGN